LDERRYSGLPASLDDLGQQVVCQFCLNYRLGSGNMNAQSRIDGIESRSTKPLKIDVTALFRAPIAPISSSVTTTYFPFLKLVASHHLIRVQVFAGLL
jgi:hypothetical protein